MNGWQGTFSWVPAARYDMEIKLLSFEFDTNIRLGAWKGKLRVNSLEWLGRSQAYLRKDSEIVDRYQIQQGLIMTMFDKVKS